MGHACRVRIFAASVIGGGDVLRQGAHCDGPPLKQHQVRFIDLELHGNAPFPLMRSPPGAALTSVWESETGCGLLPHCCTPPGRVKKTAKNHLPPERHATSRSLQGLVRVVVQREGRCICGAVASGDRSSSVSVQRANVTDR
jgi:hypothetical protein